MEHFVERKLVPSLDGNALNIIGYTASFCQVFGSVFAARHMSRLELPRILNLFGGSSFSLPEGRRTLSAWGIDGLIVKGTGEAPIDRLFTAALDLSDSSAEDDIRRLMASSGGSNVSCVRERDYDIDLTHSQAALDQLPDPDYGDYFQELRGLCQDEATYRAVCREFVSLPIEGSRGCFAKCDFCHNPNITAEFRSLTGVQVAERTLRLTRRYGVENVTFVDSVAILGRRPMRII